MTNGKYEKEDCLRLLTEKYKELLAKEENRYPKRSDFSDREVVAIKAFFGPWPRALEAAGIKSPRADDRLEKNREKRARAKRARNAAKREGARKLSDEEIIGIALDTGFSGAGVIGTEHIVFDAAFRPYCEENLCGQYGANYSCPPDCGTPEEMKARVLAYKKALVLSTSWEISDFSDSEKIRGIRASHNAAMFRLIDRLGALGYRGLMIGASGCMLCHPCKLPAGEPCAFPDRRYSCLSAYCIYVKKLAEDCGMTYDYRDGILPFFGVYLF